MAVTSAALGASSLVAVAPAEAGQLCTSSLGGSSAVSVSAQNGTYVMNGCGPNFSWSGYDVAGIEAGGSAIWVDGDSHNLQFRSAYGHTMQYFSNGQLGGIQAGTNGTDAVNVNQLRAVEAKIGSGGGNGNDVNAVHYDAGSSKGKVSLEGAGGTTVTNVKAGTQNADAVNVGQLKGITTALGSGAGVNSDGTIKAPGYTVGGTTYNNVGSALDAISADVTPKLRYIKFGATTAMDASASGTDAVAIGGFAQAMGDGSLALGANSRAMGKNAIAIGAGSSATADNTFAVGSTTLKRRIVNVADGVAYSDAATVGQVKAWIAEKFGPAVQSNSLLKSSGGVRNPQLAAAGTPNEATASKYGSTNAASTVAAQPSLLGASSTTTVAAAAAPALVEQSAAGAALDVGKNVDGTAINFRGTAGDRTLAGVAAGKVDNEAVNVGQLKSAGLMNAQGEVNSVVSYDDASRSSVTLGGQGATPVALRNVAAGSANTDAVNVSQLNQRLGETRASAVSEAKAYTDQRMGDVWNGLGQVADELQQQDRRISDVGAMSTAHAQMVANASIAAATSENGALAVGLGQLESRSAISVGYAKAIGKRTHVSVGVSFSGDEQAVGVGLGLGL